jgi:hypothetical protein
LGGFREYGCLNSEPDNAATGFECHNVIVAELYDRLIMRGLSLFGHQSIRLMRRRDPERLYTAWTRSSMPTVAGRETLSPRSALGRRASVRRPLRYVERRHGRGSVGRPKDRQHQRPASLTGRAYNCTDGYPATTEDNEGRQSLAGRLKPWEQTPLPSGLRVPR